MDERLMWEAHDEEENLKPNIDTALPFTGTYYNIAMFRDHKEEFQVCGTTSV